MYVGSDTFSMGLVFRGFTISSRIPLTDKTFTIDNKTFIGDYLIIKYENV